MQVTQVTLTIHEKRSHPFEHGHYDASVTLTASIESGDVPEVAITDLKCRARGHVYNELALWEDRVRENKRIADIEEAIGYDLGYLRGSKQNTSRLRYARKILKRARELPDYMREYYADRTRDALAASKKLVMKIEQEKPELDDLPF